MLHAVNSRNLIYYRSMKHSQTIKLDKFGNGPHVQSTPIYSVSSNLIAFYSIRVGSQGLTDRYPRPPFWLKFGKDHTSLTELPYTTTHIVGRLRTLLIPSFLRCRNSHGLAASSSVWDRLVLVLGPMSCRSLSMLGLSNIFWWKIVVTTYMIPGALEPLPPPWSVFPRWARMGSNEKLN